MELSDLTACNWKKQLTRSITSPEELADYLPVDTTSLNKVVSRYPMRISGYYLSLIKSPGDPLWKQAVPDIPEMTDTTNCDDPLHEEQQSPVKSVIHRYPDRVVFLISNQCAMYCRHCMRKRSVGDPLFHYGINDSIIEDGIHYIRNNKNIRDVILSGGDPLLLDTSKLESVLSELRTISHVDIIRIHSRVPCTLPARITDRLVSVLKKYHPLFLNTHFNHPDEITEQSSQACLKIADAGIPVGCQTVLLKDVNDSPETMAMLMRKLIAIRVKPYYLHHPDPVAGTGHFRPSLDTGLSIMNHMRGNISGICIPQYMIDLPGGYGKAPVLYGNMDRISDDRIMVNNYQGHRCTYDFK